MKHLMCIILIFIFSSASLESQALTFRSAANASYHGVGAMSSQSAFSLNEYALYRYYMAAYGDPSRIAGNRFTADANAWMTRTNDSSEKGEYQYLGYSYENILLTNDRWFAEPAHLGTRFQNDYSGVAWDAVADVQGEPVKAREKWMELLAGNGDLYDYIVSAPFFDSDHPTKGESPTGFSLASLLPGGQLETSSYLLSAPSPYEDGAVYLRYSQNGTSNYNTIQIPALPRVECVMTASADVASIERGETRDVLVTIDTRNSYALVYHQQMKSEITNRTYWARAGTIAGTAPGESTVQGICRITVPDVAPNSTIHVKASVYSQKVADMGQLAEDIETASLFIGEVVPPETGPAGGIAGTVTGVVMDAAADGVLKSDLRDGERFDVTKGIPSAETLYAQVGGREYLIRQAFHEVTGTIAYTVAVRHPVQAPVPDPVLPDLPSTVHSSSDPSASVPPLSGQLQSGLPLTTYATTYVRVSRSYSFWEISALEVYALESAVLRNGSLPGGLLTLHPSVLPHMQSPGNPSDRSPEQSTAYCAPIVDFTHQVDDLLTYHLQIGSTNRSANASSWEAAAVRNAAQSAVPAIPVRNDRLNIDGKTVLSGIAASGSGSQPVPAVPGILSRDMLFMSGLAIPPVVVNGTYPTTGTITYARLPDSVINGGDRTTITLPISGMNSVTVHTPVVLAADLVSDDAHNQAPEADSGVGSIVLGRPFVIRISNSGGHLGIPGYGSRDYSEYVADREVKLSFDAYSGSLYTGRFLKAGVWHSLAGLGIPMTENLLELKVPTWVLPGSHLAEIRTCSVNDAFGGTRVAASTAGMTASRQPVAGTPQLTGRMESGFSANLRQDDHAASVAFPVSIVGRIYDFQLTDVEDPMWETFFRIAKGNAAGTGNRFAAGTRNINGEADSARSSVLPVMPGKNTQPGFQDRAVKLGYAIRFEVKTIGDFHDANDFIRILPTFAYVDRNGKNRMEVDLYYSRPGRPLVKAGSPEDNAIWPGKLNLPYRGLSEAEWTETGKSIWQLKGGMAGYASESAYAAAFLQGAQTGADMFRTWRILLGEQARTFRGPVSFPAGETLAFASMQKWYGEYRLPPDTLIVPKGTDLSRMSHITPQDPVFLKEGYLLVNFRSMEVIGNGNSAHPALRYSGRDPDASSVDKPAAINGADPFLTDMGNGWFLEGYSTSQANRASLTGKPALPSQTDPSNKAGKPALPSQTVPANGSEWDLREGDAAAFYANRRSTDDLQGLGTH